MKKFSLVAVMLTTAAISSSAFADETVNKPYVLFEGGLSMPSSKVKSINKKFDNTSVWGIGLGYRINENLRTDLTFNYRPNNSLKLGNNLVNAGAKARSYSGMVNAYYDIASFSGFTPYLNVGAGIVKTDYKLNAKIGSTTLSDNEKKIRFAYQVGAGTLIKVADNTNLNIGYRFVDHGKVGQGYRHRSHEVLGGLQFSF